MIDFGSLSSPAPWNNLSNTQNASIANLTDRFNQRSPISINITDAFRGSNTAGTTSPNPALGLPSSASSDSFFGCDSLFNGSAEPTAAFVLRHLDTAKVYTLRIFASRMATDNRETRYYCQGRSLDSAFLNASNNRDSSLVFYMLASDSGTIHISMSSGPNNNNAFGFFYINALMIEFIDSLPTASLSLIEPKGGEFWQVGKSVELRWLSSIQAPSILDYSLDGGLSWMSIDSLPPFIHAYQWLVPNTPSNSVQLRLRSDSLLASSGPFVISTSPDSCFVVVIGSSTAAGAGASVGDSAWVSRFRRNLYQNDTRKEVINLARGGYTSYHLLPKGSTLGSNVGIAIDTNRNISKAISLRPRAIIVNLPSNDAARNFPPSDQMRNFRLMQRAADSAGIDLWVCTTQPRFFNNSRQIQIQLDTRDSIQQYFGTRSIDFWTAIADSNHHIQPGYDSGDGVHLNDKGHRLLFQEALASGLNDSLCPTDSTLGFFQPHLAPSECVQVYPNPFQDQLFFRLTSPDTELASLRIYNLQGQLLLEKLIRYPGQEIHLDLPFLPETEVFILHLMLQSGEHSEYSSFRLRRKTEPH